MNQEVFIIAAKRTPLLPRSVSLAPSSTHLLTILMRSLLEYGPWKPFDIGGIAIGRSQVPPSPCDWPRELLLDEGYPKQWTSTTFAGNSSVGLQALSFAFDRIRLGATNAMLAGGVEALMERSLWTGKVNEVVQQVGRRDGLFQKLAFLGEVSFKELSHLGRHPRERQEGEWQELLAQELGISKEEQDVWAHKSHIKAIKAIQQGHFDAEIVPTVIGDMEKLITRDSSPRRDYTLETIQNGSPCYRTLSATITEANRAPTTSGGSLILCANTSFIEQYQIAPLARLVSFVEIGTSPKTAPLASMAALAELLRRNNLEISDIDCFEVSEESALQLLSGPFLLKHPNQEAFIHLSTPLGHLPLEKINSWGGAIALGHPLAASGPRLVTTLVHRLQQSGGRYGIVLSSEIGGSGYALLMERK